MHAAILGETGADAGYGGDGAQSAALDGKWHMATWQPLVLEVVMSRGDKRSLILAKRRGKGFGGRVFGWCGCLLVAVQQKKCVRQIDGSVISPCQYCMVNSLSLCIL